MKMHTNAGRVTETDPLYAVGSLETPTCRDRLVLSGPESLRDSELLTVALGTVEAGARALVERFGFEELFTLPVEKLAGLKGLGPAKAAALLASMEMARRALHKGLGILPVISTPTETIPMLADIKDERKEFFVCLYLNARNQVIHKEVISIGSLSASTSTPGKCSPWPWRTMRPPSSSPTTTRPGTCRPRKTTSI